MSVAYPVKSDEAPAGAEDGQLVGRCYTKARRLPLVLGRWEGRALWGGPYTVPQLIAMTVVLGLVVLTYPVWGHFGFGNVLVLVGVPYGAGWAVRAVRVQGRGPFAAMAGALTALAAPRRGRLAGRPVRVPRPTLLRGGCTVRWTGAEQASRPTAAATTGVRAAAVAAAQPAAGRVPSAAGALLARGVR